MGCWSLANVIKSSEHVIQERGRPVHQPKILLAGKRKCSWCCDNLFTVESDVCSGSKHLERGAIADVYLIPIFPKGGESVFHRTPKMVPPPPMS